MLLAGAAALAGCATVPGGDPDAADIPGSAWARVSWADAEPEAGPWRHQTFPGKRPTHYHPVQLDGRSALQADAVASMSVVRRSVRVAPAALGRVSFSWRLQALIPDADLQDRDRSDSPMRLVLAFDGDRSKFSARDAMLSELAHAVTGEPMPYATLMYVWCNRQEAGTVLRNTRTGRIRKIVLESGPAHLNRWLDYDRDIRADFERAFGEAPGALVSVAVMTDADNTGGRATAWYGPIRHLQPG